MIRHKVHIRRYDWKVYCYFAVDCYYTKQIAEQLVQIGCTDDFVQKATQNMGCNNLNQGFCYSRDGCSVLVTGLTSSAEEFINSFTHELYHLVCHIAEARRFSPVGEEAAYLMGDLAREMYPAIKPLLNETDRTLL